jgi:hypothetical protein
MELVFQNLSNENEVYLSSALAALSNFHYKNIIKNGYQMLNFVKKS